MDRRTARTHAFRRPRSADSLTGWVTEMGTDPRIGDVLQRLRRERTRRSCSTTLRRDASLQALAYSRYGWCNCVEHARSAVDVDHDGRVVLWEPASGRVLHEFRSG